MRMDDEAAGIWRQAHHHQSKHACNKIKVSIAFVIGATAVSDAAADGLRVRN